MKLDFLSFMCKNAASSKMLQFDEHGLRDFNLHKRIQNLRHWRKLNKLEEELEWISFGIITSTQEEIDAPNTEGKCPLHCLLEMFLDMHFIDKRDGDIIELLMIKSKIDYDSYRNGTVIDLLKRYNRIKYYQWLILNNKEHLCLEDMNTNIFTKETLIRIRHNLDDLLQIVFVVGALKTLKVLMNMINEEYGSSYPILPIAVSYSVLVRDGCHHKFYRCFDFLLNRADVDINLTDKHGETAFFLACRINDQYMIAELLKKKPFIAALNKDGNYAVSELSPEVLTSILDSCIVQKPTNFIRDDSALKFMKMFSLPVLNVENTIFMDLRNFYPTESTESAQTFNVLELIQSIAATKDLGPILTHPVVGTILEVKWAKLRKFVVLRKLSTFIPFLVAFILSDSVITNKERNFGLVFVASALILELSSALLLLTSKFCSRRTGFCSSIVLFMVLVFLASDVCNRSEPREIENRLADTIKWSAPGEGCPAVGGVMWIFLGMSMNYLLAFFNPTVAHYSIMMIVVAYTMLRFLISNIFLAAGFVISYAAIFREITSNDQFTLNYLNGSSILDYSFKAFVMLTGEINDMPDEDKHTIWTYLAFGFLVFAIPIVTLNLINGLAISNVDHVSSQAIYWHRRVQCLLIYELEVILRKIRAVLSNPDVLGTTPWNKMLQNDFWGTDLADSGSHGSYRPMCVLSFRLNYMLSGFKPAGYHLVNILLHCLATFLVIQLARRLHPDSAGVTGLLFATHPIHTEAVAGIVGRADLIACNFYLLAFLSYVKHVDWRESGESVMRQWTALCATVLSSSAAVLCKETAVTALVICAVYDIIKGFTGYRDKARLRSLGVLCVALAVILHFRLSLPKPSTTFSTADNPTAKISSIWTRFFTFAYLPLFNFKLLLYPSKLSFDWGMDAIPRVTSIFDMRTAISAVFYVSLLRTLWFCISRIRRDGLRSAAHTSLRRKKSPSPVFVPQYTTSQYNSFEMQLQPLDCCSVCKHGLNVRHSSSCRARNNNNVPALNAPPCGCPSVTLSPSATYISSSSTSASNNNDNNSYNNNNNNNYTLYNNNNHKFGVHGAETHKYFAGEYRRSAQSTPTSSRDSSASRVEPSELSDCARIVMALAFLVLPFLPASNLLFYVGFVVAERILYLPSVGYCLLVGLGYSKLASISVRSKYKKYSKRSAAKPVPRTKNKLLIVCVCVISLVYSVKTIDRNFDWRDEESLYRSAININPPKALGNLGSVLSAQGRYTEAKEALMEALKYRPNMADVHYNLGILLQNQQDHKGAVDSFQMAIHYRPTLAVAYLNMGTSLIALGRCQEAAQILREGSRLDGTGLRDRAAHDNAKMASLLQLGNLYADQGKFQRALAIYREALHNLPERYPPQGIYHRLGDVFAKLHQWPEAERFQLAALDAQPDHVGAHISYGSMLAKNNSRIGEAEQWFRRALKLAPTDASVYHHYADFLQTLNRNEESCVNRVRAAELNSEDYSLVVGAATCLRVLDSKVESERWYRLAVKLKPDDARAHTNLGAILHLLGRNRQAASSYKEALRLQPNDPTTLANLAKLSVAKTLQY